MVAEILASVISSFVDQLVALTRLVVKLRTEYIAVNCTAYCCIINANPTWKNCK